MAENYQKQLERILEREGEGGGKRLLLHCCCAPCASYVLEYLSNYFAVTAFFYNPNITDAAEYRRRAGELARLVKEMPAPHPIAFWEGPYESAAFLQEARGLEGEKEGGARCARCFSLRLGKTAQAARAGGFDYFASTLSISPLKNAALLNETGLAMAEKHGAVWLPSDFKKKNGFKRSVELCAQYGLYRQNYCGCAFSMREASMKDQGVFLNSQK